MSILKKVLALVLVVALMMGFATVAGAADFTDSADVDHTEAVEVMTAIGVINGYPDGSFRPDGNVTRAQMAKMVAYIVSGGEDVGDLYAGATTFSDCLTHWARGYIAYANTTGIIAGVGNGRFNPDGNVTGAQAAKMMLCALGYDQDSEGYTGTGWSVNVLSDARTVGLLKGLNGVNMNAALSRENATQLMFNALTCNMVKYNRGNITVDGGDSTIIIGGSGAEPVVMENEEGNYAGDGNSTLGTRPVGYGYQQMCELYFEDLKLAPTSSDAFGRPSNKWTYGTKTIGTYAAEADATYTASVKGEKIFDDLSLPDNATVTSYTNGMTNKGTIANTDTNVAGTGNGVLVQAYATGSDEATVTIINTYVAKVDGEYDADDKELDLDDLDLNLPADSYTLSGDDFTNLSSFSDGDYVLVTVADGDIQTIVAAETVTGNVTSYTQDKNVTVGGTKYSYTKGYEGPADDYALNTDFDLVLDPYGYVIYATGVESAKNYVYITDVAEIGGVDKTFEARAYFQDGTTAVIDVNDGDKLGWTDKTTSANTWFTYDEKSNNTYDLKAITDGSKTDGSASSGTQITTNGSATINGKHRGNSDTVFVVIRGSKVNSYTGIRNVPDIKAADAVEVDVIEDNNYAKYVAIYAADTSDVNISGSVAGERIYILDATDYENMLDSSDNRYYVYDAIVNGESTTIKAGSANVFSSVGLYGDITYDANGYVDSADLIADATDTSLKAAGFTGDISYSGGVLSFGNTDLVLADDCAIFVNDGGTAKSVTAAKLDNDYEAGDKAFDGTISWVVDNNEVIEVYVDEDDSLVANKPEEDVQENIETAADSDNGAWGQAGKDNDKAYTPVGSWTTKDSTVTATYGTGEKNATVVMNDTARFLGSLYRNGNAKQIVYNGTTYVWDANGGLKGSNWYDAKDSGLVAHTNTLVHALQEDGKFNGNTVTLKVDGVDITINYAES